MAADKRSTKGVSEKVRRYAGTWADLLMESPASGRFVRRERAQACPFLIDWLKTKAPFWKREETGSGAQWVDARASDAAATARWVPEDTEGPAAAE